MDKAVNTSAPDSLLLEEEFDKVYQQVLTRLNVHHGIGPVRYTYVSVVYSRRKKTCRCYRIIERRDTNQGSLCFIDHDGFFYRVYFDGDSMNRSAVFVQTKNLSAYDKARSLDGLKELLHKLKLRYGESA